MQQDSTEVLTEVLTERLPEIRISPAMRRELNQMVASGGVSPRISDHVRMALKLYLQGINRSQSNDGIFYTAGNK